jgi:uncharacterized membrane protein YkvA (DUF1232 family)
MKWTRLFALARSGRIATWLLAVWKLFRHPDTPAAVRVLAIVVLAYAMSPIDLIPDFIPVLGMLDDVVLIPLGIALVVKLTPRPLWDACMREAEQGAGTLPRIVWGAALVVAVWLLLVGLLAWWMVSLILAGA